MLKQDTCFILFLIKSKKELKLAPVYSVFYHFCFLPSFPTAIYFFCFMGERRLKGVLSTPTMSLTPASAGADAKWHHDNGFYLRDSADADASMRDVGTQSNRDGTIVHSSL